MGFSDRFTTPAGGSFRAGADAAKRARQLKDWIKANHGDRVATWHTVHVFPDRIINLPSLTKGMAGALADPDERPIAGVTADVRTGGEVTARATLTRSLVPGLHGWQKKADTRRAFLTITGPGFVWTLEVPAGDAATAHQFAAELTAYARQAG